MTLAKTLRGWREEILNYAASGGASNGFAEAIIHLIKNQKRQAHGYRSWAGFRGQILWAFGEVVNPSTARSGLYDPSPEAREPIGSNLNSRRPINSLRRHRPSHRVSSVDATSLGKLCIAASAAGPGAFAEEFVDTTAGWAISLDGPAAADLAEGFGGLPPFISIPVKLSTLAASHLATIGDVLMYGQPNHVGLASVGRTVVEGCSAVAWLLDDGVTPEERHRRAWLLWAIAEGNAALTAAADAGRTGAMVGSPRRLAEIELSIRDQLGIHLERSAKSKPKDWRLDGVELPGPRRLVVEAVDRWFPGADGSTLYSQVSRQAHSDVLVALAVVDDALAIPDGEGLDFVPTTLAFWGLTWNHLLTYLGLVSTRFDAWLEEMLIAIGRGDLVNRS